jgi:hypothetical protein
MQRPIETIVRNMRPRLKLSDDECKEIHRQAVEAVGPIEDENERGYQTALAVLRIKTGMAH